MSKIPVHRISDKFDGQIAALRYVSEKDMFPAVSYAHRDDYYIFMLGESGYGKMLIDFEEYEMSGDVIVCVLPGQVHFPLEIRKACAWVLAVDSMFIKDEYRAVFEKVSFAGNQVEPTKDVADSLKQYVALIYARLKAEKELVGQAILHDLLSSYIGMMAEVYQKGFPASVNNRVGKLTFHFKSLLSANYQTLKRPWEYASCMNISSVYLNEAVKKTTGMSVSECILNEIVLQAKRLLFYTAMSVKEIAQELGYEDYAYFTRLFTKSCGVSPTQFRAKYLK